VLEDEVPELVAADVEAAVEELPDLPPQAAHRAARRSTSNSGRRRVTVGEDTGT
jgi:hypothetical protein